MANQANHGPVGDPYTSYTVTNQSTFDFSPPETIEVVVEEEEDGEFKVYRIVEKMVPKKVKEGMNFKLFKGKNFGEFMEWMSHLNNDELEAARQIYFDIWNFKTGDSDDKARFELIEGEQKKRKAQSSITGNGGSITLTAGTGVGVGAGGIVSLGSAGAGCGGGGGGGSAGGGGTLFLAKKEE